MKTITCETPGTFVRSDDAMPERKPGEALIKIRRVGVCGTDIHAFAGRQPFFTYPRVLGHELGAEIIEVDANDAGLEKGDHVCVVPALACGKCIACRNGRTNCCTSIQVVGVHCDGGMREYISLPVENLVKNNTLEFDQLALVECFAIGAHAVRRADVQKGEKVLVVGAGPIGLGLLQFAAARGGEVIVMDVDADRLAFARDELGVKHTIQVGKEDANARLEEITGGDYPSVIFDCTGNKKAMEAGFLYLAHGGRYVLVSLVMDDISFPDPEFHKRETTLLSSRNATPDDFAWVIECMEKGLAKTAPFITHRCAFDELTERFESWTKPGSGVIKAVIEM